MKPLQRLLSVEASWPKPSTNYGAAVLHTMNYMQTSENAQHQSGHGISPAPSSSNSTLFLAHVLLRSKRPSLSPFNISVSRALSE